MANIKCQSFTEIFTPHPLFFGMHMWHLPSLPYIHSLVLTYLQHICNIFVRRKLYFVQIHFSYSLTNLGTCTCLLVFNVCTCMPDIIQGASHWLCRTIVLFTEECKKNHRALYPPPSLPQLCVYHKYMHVHLWSV